MKAFLPAVIVCSKCKKPLPVAVFSYPAPTPCPQCRAATNVLPFPAINRHLEVGKGGTALLEQSDASCFYHPENEAAAVCDRCGRFLCALCDITFGREHLCATCLSSGRKKGKLQNVQNHRVLYDNLVLTLSILPVIIWWLTIITAPLAIFMAVRYWNEPCSILGRSRLRYILAIIISSVLIIMWISVIGLIIFSK